MSTEGLRPGFVFVLAIAICAFVQPVSAQEEQDRQNGEQPVMLEPVKVLAVPLGSTPGAFEILQDKRLLLNTEGTLGETLNTLPGVRAGSFGAGVARPIIRGQRAPRVTILSSGAKVFDASGVSPDHAISVSPLLSNKIEVLLGPSTLLYGGGAIGGVVNVLDNRVPTAVPADSPDGFLTLRGDTVANSGAAAGGATFGIGEHFAWHVEGLTRESDNYAVNGFTVPEIKGTFAESDVASAGASWIGDWGYFGVAYTSRASLYGLPGHSHEFANCVADGAMLDCGGSHHHHHHHEHAAPYVDLESDRVDVRGEYALGMYGIENISFRGSHTDYWHGEIEEGQVGTAYTHEAYAGRVEIHHVPLFGWDGIVGFQYSDATFDTSGLEAVVPRTDTQIMALFAVERRQLAEDWELQVGARYERQELTPRENAARRFGVDMGALSAAAALSWQFMPGYEASLNLSRSQRLPNAQEVYASGVHVATQAYECGILAPANCGGLTNTVGEVEEETSRNIALNLSKNRGKLRFDIGVYYNSIDNYVYARTIDRIEAFRLIKYTQAEAHFFGADAQLTYHWNEHFSSTVFGDTVNAELSETDEPLPRIPGNRIGLRLNGYYRDFAMEVEYIHVDDQDDLADYETHTPGYNLLNVALSYEFGADSRYTLFLRGTNLLGDQVFNHTSFLAARVPEPGRNVTAGMRVTF